MDTDDKTATDTTQSLKLAAVDKRIDDFKWFLGGLGGLLSLAFSVMVLVSSWNSNAERASLREFQRELKADVGKLEAPPDVVLIGRNGQDLNGQEIQVPISRTSDGASGLAIGFRMLNRGDGLSGPIYQKFYTKYPLNSGSSSTDDPAWEFESYSTPASISPQEIPGKFSVFYVNRIPMRDPSKLSGSRYPALIKVYYGKGKIAQATVTLYVEGEESLPSPRDPAAASPQSTQETPGLSAPSKK